MQKEHFDAEVHVLPGAGHWPMIPEPEPERVCDWVLAFLRVQLARV